MEEVAPGTLPELYSLDDFRHVGMSIDGYGLGHHLGLDKRGGIGVLARTRSAQYRRTGEWRGSATELWLCLFFTQRLIWHFEQDNPDDDLGEYLVPLATLYAALRDGLLREYPDVAGVGTRVAAPDSNMEIAWRFGPYRDAVYLTTGFQPPASDA